MSRNGPLARGRIAFEGLFDFEAGFRVMVRLHTRCCQHTDEHCERSTNGSRSGPCGHLGGSCGSRLGRHGRVNWPRARVAAEFPDQAQQTQQHGRDQEPLEPLYADTGIRVSHPSRATGLYGVFDQFAHRGLLWQRRCRHVVALGARRKVLQSRGRKAGDDRVLVFVQ